MNTDEKSGVEVMLEYIKRDIKEIKEKMDSHYVTSKEFEPVRNTVYGMVALILTSALVSILTYVIKH